MQAAPRDYRFLKNCIHKYSIILRRASSLLNTSAELRPPVLHRYGEMENEIAHVFETWAEEYSNAIMVLKHWRNKFQLQT